MKKFRVLLILGLLLSLIFYSVTDSKVYAATYGATETTNNIQLNGMSAYTTSATVPVRFEYDSGITGVYWGTDYYTVFYAAKASMTAVSGTYYLTNFTFSSGDGTKTLYAKFWNSRTGQWANYSNTFYIINHSITLDSIAPTGSISINGGAANTNNSAVTLTISASDGSSGVSEMMVANNSSFTGASWETYATSKSWTLAAGDGTKTVYIKFKDVAGNVSGSYNDSILLDTTAPTMPTINYSSPSGYTSGSWTNQNVTFTVTSGTDSGSGVQKSQYSTNGGTTWTDYSSAVTISTAGTTTVMARTIDNVGNISANDTDTVKIDKTAPAAPTIAFTAPTGYTSGTWTNQNVTYTITSGTDTGGSGVSKSQYSINGGTTWADYSGAVTVSTEGTTTVLARTLDNAGNISTNSTATIKLDKTGPSGSISINSGASETSTTSTTLSISATDTLSGVSQMKVSNDSGFAGAAWEAYVISKSWTLASTGGTATVYIQFKDAVGNVSTTNSNILYIVRPTINTITVSGSRYYGVDMPISATGTNASQAGYRIYYTTSVTAPPVNAVVNGADPGAGWIDSGVSGSMNADSSTNVSGIVSGLNLTNTTWTYITLKVAIGSVTDTWVWNYSRAYSLSQDPSDNPDAYITNVAHNQILLVNGKNIIVTDPTTPETNYGPYSITDINAINSFNTFMDGDFVKYRLEFDVANPAKIIDLKVALNFVGNIDLRLNNMNLQKRQANGSFQVIKDLNSVFVKRGTDRYTVLLGNDNGGVPILAANGSGRYAIEYSGRIRVSPIVGATVDTTENDAKISIISSSTTYPFIIQPEKPGRKLYINTKVTGQTAIYR